MKNERIKSILLWVCVVLVILLVLLLILRLVKPMKDRNVTISPSSSPTDVVEEDNPNFIPSEEEKVIELNQWGIPIDELETSEAKPVEEYQLKTQEILLTNFKVYEENKQTIVEETLMNTSGRDLTNMMVINKLYNEGGELVAEYPIIIPMLAKGESTTMGGPVEIPLASIKNIQAEVANTSDKMQ